MKSFFQKIYVSLSLIVLYFLPTIVWAEAEVVDSADSTVKGYYALGAGLAISIAALGGALGQGRVGAAAMEGVARNPQAQKIMFIPMIIVLALIESFVIFSFAVSMILIGKI